MPSPDKPTYRDWFEWMHARWRASRALLHAQMEVAASPSNGNRLRLARAEAHLRQVETNRP